MEIKPTYVTFEQAKLLKEKGFDIPTLTAFDDEDGIIISSYSKDVFSRLNYNNSGYKTSRPEQWELVEWLRINYGIYISVLVHSKNGKGVFYESFVNSMTFSGFNLPQEAYSEAFDYILKELI